MDDKQYDYKQASNKDLSFKERFDYLKNARHDADTPNKMIGGIAGAMAQQGGAINQAAAQAIPPQPLPVQSMTNVPPVLNNTIGTAKPVFNQPTEQAAQGIYGTIEQRQSMVNAAPMFMAIPKDKKINK